VKLLHAIESEAQSVSSYVDLIQKVIKLIGDKNLSTYKIAARVLKAVGNYTLTAVCHVIKSTVCLYCLTIKLDTRFLIITWADLFQFLVLLLPYLPRNLV